MRESTLLTRLLGGGALACAAAAICLTYADFRAPWPRWEQIGAGTAALLLAAAWAAACRLAPPLRPASAAPDAAPGHVPPPIPAKFRPPAKDYGLAFGALLTVLGPVTALRCVATNDGSSGIGPLGGIAMLLLLVPTLGLLAYVVFGLPARRRLGAKHRVLLADAASGKVHAVRVRIGATVWQRHSTRGDKPGAIAVMNNRRLEVRTDSSRSLRIHAMHPAGGGFAQNETQLALLQAGTQLTGQEAWLCWPSRWKLIEGSLPVALVCDSGHITWGEVDRDASTRHLRTGPQSTTPDRATRALPRPAKFRPRLHLPQLALLLAAYVLLLPTLLGLLGSVPALSWLLCAAAAAAIAASGLNVTTKVEQLSDDLDWKIIESVDPSIA